MLVVDSVADPEREDIVEQAGAVGRDQLRSLCPDLIRRDDPQWNLRHPGGECRHLRRGGSLSRRRIDTGHDELGGDRGSDRLRHEGTEVLTVHQNQRGLNEERRDEVVLGHVVHVGRNRHPIRENAGPTEFENFRVGLLEGRNPRKYRLGGGRQGLSPGVQEHQTDIRRRGREGVQERRRLSVDLPLRP